VDQPQKDIDPATFGSTRIGPDGLDAEVVLDTKAEPNVFMKDYTIQGVSADGLPAGGTFSVMRPPELKRETMQPIADPGMQAKIMRAMEILGKKTVSDEDLRALALSGVFKDIPDTQKDGFPRTVSGPPQIKVGATTHQSGPAPPADTTPPPSK
jgi:hypothetical protein